MNDHPEIKYVRNADIDISKWDECINNSFNSRVYALSVYLNNMCSTWDALIADDYKIVMPIPYRSKFGIQYLYQPAFTQQLGIFSSQEITKDIVDQFLKSIPKSFLYWDIALNATNSTDTYNSRHGKNYLLSLNQSYEKLQENYNRNAKRNIRKAIDEGITVIETADFDITISLHRKRFNDKIGAYENDYKNLKRLLEELQKEGSVYSVTAKDKDGNIIASSTYVVHKNRIIFLINGNLAASLETGATHLLKDQVIKKFAGNDMLMDFEGSDHEQFAKFYEQFGAKDIEYYPVIINNKLPWPFKYLKRSTPAV